MNLGRNTDEYNNKLHSEISMTKMEAWNKC